MTPPVFEGESCSLGPGDAQEPRHFGPIFLQAALTGVAAGAVGSLFHMSTDWLETVRDRIVDAAGYISLPVAILVSAGLALAAVAAVRRLAPEAGGSGIQEVEGALAGLRPFRWFRVLVVKFFAGTLALGSGMVLGREGPTIQMGGALGRLFAGLSASRTPYARHCLVAAGAGAGLTAAFNAPLAGILFVVEEMREQFHFDFVSFHSVVVACAAATVTCRLIAGPGQAIPMPELPAPSLTALGLFLAFGVSVGLAGMVFNAALVRTLDLFEGFSGRERVLAVACVGGLAGLCAWGVPAVAGGGHAALLAALDYSQPVWTLMVFFVLRFMLTMLSYATGAPGGIFAPMLALGTLWGVFYGFTVMEFFPRIVPEPDAFAVAGMGALFAATVRAPMTGMVLIMEMTQNYSMTLPLMVTCIAAAATAEALGARPIYRVLLERVLDKGKHTPIA